MRSSDILRPGIEKGREWDSLLDIDVGRITWESVDPESNVGRSLMMNWKLKPSKKGSGRAALIREIASHRRGQKRHISGLRYFMSEKQGPVVQKLGEKTQRRRH